MTRNCKQNEQEASRVRTPVSHEFDHILAEAMDRLEPTLPKERNIRPRCECPRSVNKKLLKQIQLNNERRLAFRALAQIAMVSNN